MLSVQSPPDFRLDPYAFRRHWSLSSEPYAGGDALLTLLSSGWSLSAIVFSQEFWYGDARRVRAYYCDLYCEGETVRMPVLVNPVVESVVRKAGCRVVQMNQRKNMQREVWGALAGAKTKTLMDNN